MFPSPRRSSTVRTITNEVPVYIHSVYFLAKVRKIHKQRQEDDFCDHRCPQLQHIEDMCITSNG